MDLHIALIAFLFVSSSFCSEVEEMRREFQEYKSSSEERITNLETKNTNLEKRNSNLEKKLAYYDEKILELFVRHEDLSETIQNQSIKQNETKNELKNENNEQSRKIAAIENEDRNVNSRVKHLELMSKLYAAK